MPQQLQARVRCAVSLNINQDRRGLGSNVGVAFDSQDKNHPVVKEVQVHGAGSVSISASQILDQVYGGLTEMWNSTCLPEQTVKAQYPQLFLNSWCKESQPLSTREGVTCTVLSCTCICELWHSSISLMQHIVTWLSFNTSTSAWSSELETKRSKAQSTRWNIDLHLDISIYASQLAP